MTRSREGVHGPLVHVLSLPLLSDTFGTSLAMNNAYYLVVKIGMDNWLIPAIFSQSFSTFGGLTDSRGLLERINNYYCYWEPGSCQFRVQHDIAIILRNPTIRFNASLDRLSKLLKFPSIQSQCITLCFAGHVWKTDSLISKKVVISWECFTVLFS